MGTRIFSDTFENTKLEYRRDIDGLRAIAVLLVVTYHGFPQSFKGGFLGVDIFFVLSGFLITSLISNNTNSTEFSLRQFYASRIRRIFPSLIIMMTSCLVVGWFVLRSEEFAQLGNETLAGSLFYSNFYYLSQDNYFDVASEIKPFLHLWSLAIEEQFYVFFPIFFIFLSKLLKNHNNRLLAIVILATCSFAACFLLTDSPSLAFYLPVTRWWEILFGGALALSSAKSRRKVAHSNLFALVGVASIAIGVILASVAQPFPTYLGAPVVIGALVIIANGRDSKLVNFIIGGNLLVLIGKISYPLYLWHWPILVMARIVYGEQPPIEVRASLIILSFLLAWLNTKFIESPIRMGLRRGRTMFLLSCPLLVIGLAGLVVSRTDGFPSRGANNQQIKYDGDTGHLQFHKYISENFFPCTPAKVYELALSWEGYVRCNQSKREEPIDVLLLGDSHAEHLFIGLAESLKDKNVGFYIRGVSIDRAEPEFNQIYRSTLTNPTIRTVILGNMWKTRNVRRGELVAVFQELLDNGKRVFVTDDVPIFDIDPDLCKFDGVCGDKSIQSDLLQNSNYLELIAAIRAVPEVTLIETFKYFCSGSDGCSMRDSRHVLYRDPNHLNIYGSRIIGRLITQDHPILNK